MRLKTIKYVGISYTHKKSLTATALTTNLNSYFILFYSILWFLSDYLNHCHIYSFYFYFILF